MLGLHSVTGKRHNLSVACPENAVANLKSNCEFVGVLSKPTLDFSVQGEIQLQLSTPPSNESIGQVYFRAKYLTEPQQEIRGSVAYNLIEDGVSSRTTIRTATTNCVQRDTTLTARKTHA